MMSSLWNAVMEDDVEMLQEMVRFGEVVDLSKYSDCGNGLMYVAVAKSRRRVLAYLHAMGLDVHSYCDQRQFGTPLFHAIYHECADVIRDLYFLGVDMEAPCDRFGHPPEKAAEILGRAHLIPQLQGLKTLRHRCSLRLTRFFRMARDRRRFLTLRTRHRSAIRIQRRARGMAVRVRLDREEREERARALAAKEQAEAQAAAAAREVARQEALAKASEEASSKSGSGSSGGKSGASQGGGGWLGWAKNKVKK